MGPVAAAHLTPAYPGIPPLGLGSDDVESFTGYVVRLGNAFAVSASVLLTPALNAVLPPARRDLHYRRNGALNGAGPAVLHAAGGIAPFTGQRDTQRLSSHALVDLLHLVACDLVSHTPRWCPLCWAYDAEPYDRKLWSLAVVDVCPAPSGLLETRCWDLWASSALVDPRRAPERMLVLRPRAVRFFLRHGASVRLRGGPLALVRPSGGRLGASHRSSRADAVRRDDVAGRRIPAPCG